MQLTTLFIKRPVMTTLVMIGILVFGIVAYRQLPVSDLPNVDFPTVTVSATLPGTSPQTMAATVATPLEKAFSTIAGIDNMTSTSSLGQTQIVVQFALDRNIDAAAQDIQAAIAQTSRSLPQGIIPPAYQKTNPADAPILTLALTSDEVPLSVLDEFGETTLAQRLSMVGGVAQVLVYGAQKYAVRLQLDPGQLATRGIALEDIATAIASQNVNMPTGVLYGPKTALTVQATGQLENAKQFSDVIVAYRNGAPVHLDEVGRITDDVQNDKVKLLGIVSVTDEAERIAAKLGEHRCFKEVKISKITQVVNSNRQKYTLTFDVNCSADKKPAAKAAPRGARQP